VSINATEQVGLIEESNDHLNPLEGSAVIPGDELEP